MKWIVRTAVGAALGLGAVNAANARVFVGVGVALPPQPVVSYMPMPVYAPPVAPPPVYYAPPPAYVPPPVYGPPPVVYRQPAWWWYRY